MVSQVIIDRLKKAISSHAIIYLHNGFRYEGKITNCDDNYVEILQDKNNSYKIIEIATISDADIENEVKK